ncbi:MAG TPA: CPXCG motif-containing cysteine-rich protein [Rhodanobacter sp.]|nr:CPXCG motif-containing cysteine-rich protein [Rhodanobacter sp.]
MLDLHPIDCPYCGETIDVLIDSSIRSQRYIEDCQVCCRPMMLSVRANQDGAVEVVASAENDA